MSRQGKGARLWLRPDRFNKAGKLRERSAWVVRDGSKFIATGCGPQEIAKAEEFLANYIGDKYEPARRERDIEHIPIADVLSIYIDEKREKQADKNNFDLRMRRLIEWWGEKTLSEVTGENCRAFAAHVKKAGSARRELEDLRAAINHHCKEGYHRGVVRVALPEKGKARDRWLTRKEAAKLVWICWRYREIQTVHRGKNKGQPIQTDRHPLRHIARFILIALYTGTRSGAILSASPYKDQGHSWVDLERGIFYRLAEGKKATKKRQTPVPLPPQLLAHLRRWEEKRIFATHFVEWAGKPISSVRSGFERAVEFAKLPGKITPHTLRHTATTWLVQAGVSTWEVAGYTGMSPEMVEKVYGHHHPDYLKNAVAAFGKHRQSVGISVGVANS